MSLTWALCDKCEEIYTYDTIVHHQTNCSFCGYGGHSCLASSPYFADKKEAQEFRENLKKKFLSKKKEE